MTYLSRRDFLWIVPLSLAFGAGLSSLQRGNWLIGWLAFSFLLLVSIALLAAATRWAVDYQLPITNLQPSDPKLKTPSTLPRTLALLVTLAFASRLAAGVGTYLLLPVDGYDDPDDRAGFVFTDAHRRDDQAWDLAASDLPITDAFSSSYAFDQYGGLLAFSALIYRYLSPDVHRPLMLALVSAFVAALGLPFLWKAASEQWGARVALTASWIFALYPESVLLGGAAMREPYLMTFSAFALWGFVSWRGHTGGRVGGARPPYRDHQGPARASTTGGLDTWRRRWSMALGRYADWAPLLDHRGLLWLGLGLLGMLLVSPAVALVTLVILAGWLYLSSERGRIPWPALAAAALIFVVGLFALSAALDRQGDLGAPTPFGVVNNWLREAVKWDVYQLERGSGWVQKLFDEMPEWLRLPFVTVYGVFQPVLPAAVVEPTTATWKVIAVLRAAGWYALLPALVYAAVAGPSAGAEAKHNVWLWLAVVCWGWILFTSLRGGGDQWDNPRYRAILFVWQALVAGYALVRWREGRSRWFPVVLACEAAFLLVFTQWYASRYFHWGGQLPFAGMVALILGLWVAIVAGGWAWGRRSGRTRNGA